SAILSGRDDKGTSARSDHRDHAGCAAIIPEPEAAQVLAQIGPPARSQRAPVIMFVAQHDMAALPFQPGDTAGLNLLEAVGEPDIGARLDAFEMKAGNDVDHASHG